MAALAPRSTRCALPAAALALALLAGCSDDDAVADDDAAQPPDARAVPDASPAPDRVEPLLWVELSVSGCASGGVDDEPCLGSAPLELRFHAVTPAPIDTYLWSFGDGTPITDDASPVHRFERAGVYDLVLTVGGTGGTATTTRTGFVVVDRAPLGARCAAADQCEAGLDCLCGDGAPCPAGLASGLCTLPCASDAECGAGVCGDLDPADVTAPASWQARLCLVACESDAACAPGQLCQQLRRAEGGLTRACLGAGVLSDIGASCADAGGALVGARCASGLCAPLGVRGACSLDCATASCPDDAACAQFGDGRRLCVATCGASESCDRDPWLACEPPGADGANGFEVQGEPAVGGYCAPRSCGSDDACGPDGRCVAGHCRG